MRKVLARLVFTGPTASSPKLFLLASGALLLSALMQFATTWMQLHSQEHRGCYSEPGGILPSTTGRYSTDFEDDYSWKDDDYPNALPLDLGGPVALIMEDSRHYTLDGPDADLEWNSIYPGNDIGFVRLGPNKRLFGLSMHHQIHCLDSLRLAILGRHHENRRRQHDGKVVMTEMDHTDHCLNYLRQAILCSADLTLEPELVEGSNDAGEGLAVTHVCRDWSKVYDFAQRNYEEWEVWRNST